MKFLIQFLIIIAFSFAGELLHFLLPLSIPASIYGIILLFLALETKLIKVKHIRETSSFLIAIMPVMFIPAARLMRTPKKTESWNNWFISSPPFLF